MPTRRDGVQAGDAAADVGGLLAGGAARGPAQRFERLLERPVRDLALGHVRDQQREGRGTFGRPALDLRQQIGGRRGAVGDDERLNALGAPCGHVSAHGAVPTGSIGKASNRRACVPPQSTRRYAWHTPPSSLGASAEAGACRRNEHFVRYSPTGAARPAARVVLFHSSVGLPGGVSGVLHSSSAWLR